MSDRSVKKCCKATLELSTLTFFSSIAFAVVPGTDQLVEGVIKLGIKKQGEKQ
ncbi:hypothetical protein [uncultured Halopseudomonas sp.]|uniref:hypothetical protein n=1 Tax=uncultured Halopseudomonas sp. TaxID=2901193 RepID=UPI0030EECB5A|tara:strand:- start:9018 stop:9176 length:159 start_codon:yes stop_codon:yes gene_type:complete